MVRWLGLCAVLLPVAAEATNGLQWQWPEGESRRYVINSQTQTSAVFWLRAENNLERRIAEWRVNLNLLCTPGVAGKRGLEVLCAIEDFSLAVDTHPKDRDKLDQILDEYDTIISKAGIRMRLGFNGRVSEFQLTNLKHRSNNDRVRKIQESMRLMLARPMAALDLQLPKGGDDQSKMWSTKTSALMDFPSLTGTTGGFRVVNQVASSEDSTVVIESSGEGVRGPAITDSRGKTPNLWKMKFFSSTTFDTKRGMMLEREALCEGKITAGSALAQGGSIAPYVQAFRISYIPEGETIEAFGPNEVLTK